MSKLKETLKDLLPFTFVSIAGTTQYRINCSRVDTLLQCLTRYSEVSDPVVDEDSAKLLERFKVKNLFQFGGYEGYGGYIGDVVQVTDTETGDTEMFSRSGTYNSWDYEVGPFEVCNNFTAEEVIKKFKRYTFESSYGDTVIIDVEA